MSKEAIVWYEVEFAGKKLTPYPYSVSFERMRGKHTICVVTGLYPPTLPLSKYPKLPDPGVPAEVRWGTKPSAMRTWYGYVHHTEPGYSEEHRSDVVSYVLVGTGHALEEQHTKDWRNITDSGIAQQIAQDYGLSLVAHKTQRVYEYLLQPGVSDLDWLKIRAKECGRIVHVENGVLYFVDPASMAMAKKQQPVKEIKVKGMNPDRIAYVSPLYGTLVPKAGKQAKRALTGFDIETNRLINAKQVPREPAPDFVARGTKIASPADLYQGVNAFEVEHEEWFHGSMSIIADSDVDHLPGQLIELTGNGVQKQMHGTWMITGSSHYLQSRHVCGFGHRAWDSELTISRNSAKTFEVRDRRIPGVDDRCVRSGGKWRSASQQVVLL